MSKNSRTSSSDREQKPLLVPLNEATRLLGLGRTKVYALMAAGSLRPVKIGRRTLLPLADLEGFIASLPTASLRGGDRT